MCCSQIQHGHLLTVAVCVRFGLDAPDARGRVRWLGVLWRGVPYPLRVWLIAGMIVRAWRKRKTDQVTWRGIAERLARFDGCGCLDALKRLFE